MKKRTNAELQSDIRDLRAQLREANAEHHAADLKARTLAIDLEHAVNAKDRLKRRLAASLEETARLNGRLQQIEIDQRNIRDNEPVTVERRVLQPTVTRHVGSGMREELMRATDGEARTHWTAE